jgi:hypothetical protein
LKKRTVFLCFLIRIPSICEYNERGAIPGRAGQKEFVAFKRLPGLNSAAAGGKERAAQRLDEDLCKRCLGNLGNTFCSILFKFKLLIRLNF